MLATDQKINKCHPDRASFCKGLCKSCYNAQWWKNHPEKRKETYAKNIDKIRASDRERYKKNKQKRSLQNEQSRFRCRYGMTLECKTQMFIKQNSLCKICEKTLDSISKAHVDHCHKTGKVRGLLCLSCNTGIGHLKDSIDILTKAIKYLENPNG